jgi:hypothetical protein
MHIPPRRLLSTNPSWRPQARHPQLCYTKPFTPAALTTIRKMLAMHHAAAPWPPADGRDTHAAVLVPLCNVRGRPGVLLEVRGGGLRSHSGEVRCASDPHV